MRTLNYSPYLREVPFEHGIEHPLASESCMITMLYGACIALGRISTESMSPEDFLESAARYGYENGRWMHAGVGEFLAGLGVNFLSIDRNYTEHDVDEMIRVGRLNNPDTKSYMKDIIDGTATDGLARISRKLILTLGGHVLWGMRSGVNGYNGFVQPTAHHYLGFLAQLPGVGTRIWDPDLRPYLDEQGLRPPHMRKDSEPGTYVIDYSWLIEHSNGRLISVWTDESRAACERASYNNPQLDADTQIDARTMLLQRSLTPESPIKEECGYKRVELGETQAIYTYGANIKSPDGVSQLRNFGREIGVETFVMPNTGAHSGDVVITEGRSCRFETNEVVLHPPTEENCDGLIIISPSAPLCIPGADCPVYVGSGQLTDGRRIIFGAHSGQIGMLRGLNENMVAALRRLDLKEGSVKILVGPGAHSIELDIPYVQTYDNGIHNWKSAVVREYIGEDGRPRIILNVVASVVDTLNELGALLAEPPKVVMSNTLADPNVWSERGMAMHGLLPTKSNAVVVF